MTARNVRLVYLKEMRDTIRDRRTLFISIVLPILLYPLLLIGFSQVLMKTARDIAERRQPVAVAGGDSASLLVARLQKGAEEAKVEIVTSMDPAADLEKKGIEAWVEPAGDFDAAIAEGRQGDVIVHYDSTRDASSAARRKIARVLEGYGREVLKDRGLSDADIEPVKVEDDDAASTEERGAKRFGPSLALLLVIMALSGAFYPAVDIMAGEKERGTMETLLVCPATRTEIVVGKYLTVLTITVVAALLNFASMGVTFAHFTSLLPKGGAGGMALSVSPLVAVSIVLALLPLAGLFSAASLAMSTFARTYKEGQHYLTPLFVLVTPLAMVAMVPETRLDSFALLPVTGVVLLVRDLMIGDASLGSIALVLGSTAVYCAIAIGWTVSLFNREEVLFRDPGGTEFTLFRRKEVRGGVPSTGQALLLCVLSMALVVLLVTRMSPGTGFLFQHLGLTLGLAVLAAWWYRLSPVRTFSLRWPRPRIWISAVIGAPAMLVLVMGVSSLLPVEEESLQPIAEQIAKILEQIGPFPILFLPPIVEEIFFRGFVLSGLRSRGRTVTAVVLTALIFGAFHLSVPKILTTGMIGVWLGYLVVAGGSIWPAIYAHLLNNALAFYDPELLQTSLPYLIGPAIVVLGVAIWLAERERRAGAQPPGE